MNIYFACSVTSGRAFQPIYQSITRALIADGHVVPTAHLAELGVEAEEKVIDPGVVYKRDVAWIRSANALIAEVSVPSHGVGYEIGYALNLGKPVLCLFEQERPVSKMITGNPDSKLKTRPYRTPAQAVELMREFLAGISFNL